MAFAKGHILLGRSGPATPGVGSASPSSDRVDDDRKVHHPSVAEIITQTGRSFLDILNELRLIQWRTSATRIDLLAAFETVAAAMVIDDLQNVRAEQTFLSRAFW